MRFRFTMCDLLWLTLVVAKRCQRDRRQFSAGARRYTSCYLASATPLGG
jgi:hypothetical protein